MTSELADFLKKATDHCGQQELTRHDSYSGRGMMGETTIAVVVNREAELLLNVIQYVRDGMEFASPGTPDFIPDVSGETLRRDNLGNQTILY